MNKTWSRNHELDQLPREIFSSPSSNYTQSLPVIRDEDHTLVQEIKRNLRSSHGSVVPRLVVGSSW